jgi:hypothetical protein
MKDILAEDKYDFIKTADKAFINEFDGQMNGIGYDYGDNIGSGYCWGRYMLIYSKTGQKSKKVTARIYIRDNSIVLRLFLNDIDSHREYVEKAPDYIQEPFINSFGRCNHCRDNKESFCKFRKTYTLKDQFIEKCNGITFEFWNPSIDKISEYIGLLTEFYPVKRAAKK